MKTIAHRQLRNDSSAVLAAVSTGETFRVTNRGRVVAFLIPPTATPFEVLMAAGKVQPARTSMAEALRDVTAAGEGPTTAELMDELRGE